MKLQNTHVKPKVAFVNVLLLIIFFTSILFWYLNINIFKDESKIIAFISFLGLIYMNYLGCPFFKYDSNGETLIFKNEKSLYISLLAKEKQSDFPKTKLIKVEVRNQPLFKRKIDIYIHTKRLEVGYAKVSFDISYLNKKQVKGLSASLNKVVEDNQPYINGKKSMTEA